MAYHIPIERRRYPERRSVITRLGAVVLLMLTGCAATVTPPGQVADPVAVYVLDHGRTSSLVLPSDGQMVRYAYGEWRYYALNQRGWMAGPRAVLWPTQAALGRKVIPGPATPAAIREQVLVPIEAIHPVPVERARAQALRKELDAFYEARLSREVANPAADLRFVPHPADYHLFHNSNHVVAAWLEALGAQVGAAPVVSEWRVEAGPARVEKAGQEAGETGASGL